MGEAGTCLNMEGKDRIYRNLWATQQGGEGRRRRRFDIIMEGQQEDAPMDQEDGWVVLRAHLRLVKMILWGHFRVLFCDFPCSVWFL